MKFKLKTNKSIELFEFEIEKPDGVREIKVINFTILNEVGKEIGWENEGELGKRKKIEREKFLNQPPNQFNRGEVYVNKDVIANAHMILKRRYSDCKNLRKLASLFAGYNCPSGKVVKVVVDGGETITFHEFCEKYLN